MPLKIILKNGEKIIINGAVLQNVGGTMKALVLNEAAILREKDIITDQTAQTPASRAYFALQNLYLFPENRSTYLPLVHRFFTDYAEAAPSAAPLVKDILKEVAAEQFYPALRLARKLVAHEGSIMGHADEELSSDLQQDAPGKEPAADRSLGADRGGPPDEGGAKGTG